MAASPHRAVRSPDPGRRRCRRRRRSKSCSTPRTSRRPTRVEVSLDRTRVRRRQPAGRGLCDNDWRPSDPALESVEWDRAAPPHPGQTVTVDVTWTVHGDAGRELLGDAPTARRRPARRIAGADLLAGGEMPPTTDWEPGQRVTLTFDLVLDAVLAGRRVPAADRRLRLPAGFSPPPDRASRRNDRD